MADDTTYVYLRLSPDTRHSQVDFEEIEALAGGAGSITITPDARDHTVYSFALPQDIDATRLISALVIKPYIDEAWKKKRRLRPLRRKFGRNRRIKSPVADFLHRANAQD